MDCDRFRLVNGAGGTVFTRLLGPVSIAPSDVSPKCLPFLDPLMLEDIPCQVTGRWKNGCPVVRFIARQIHGLLMRISSHTRNHFWVLVCTRSHRPHYGTDFRVVDGINHAQSRWKWEAVTNRATQQSALNDGNKYLSGLPYGSGRTRGRRPRTRSHR